MRIGVLTYYKVKNFGANLQAVSTYCYLQNNGHCPVFINYFSKELYKAYKNGLDDPQWNEHINFVNSIIKNQTEICFSADDVYNEAQRLNIEAIIVGSDALLQHHPLISRIKKAKRRIIYIEKATSDRLFPNVFWGCGIANRIPMALMSVSSQDSAFDKFLPSTKRKMLATLSRMRMITVRDTWTRDMVKSIINREVKITPDPVFAFNQNAGGIVPSKESIIKKYSLPERYVLLSMFYQALTEDCIYNLKKGLNELGISLVILPMPEGINFKHSADYVINLPLPTIEWYALIKYSCGYIGNNMHPIVTCLHNAVPCFSIDNWGRTNFWGHQIGGSSKVKHILDTFNVGDNHRMVERFKCNVTADEIINALVNFPVEDIKKYAIGYLDLYNAMMTSIINSLR